MVVLQYQNKRTLILRYERKVRYEEHGIRLLQNFNHEAEH